MPSSSSPRTIKKATDKFNQNITKRGQVIKAKEEKLGVGPIVLGILVFIVVGSAISQIFRGY